MNLADIKNAISSRLATGREWLVINQTGESFALADDEIELSIERERILLSFQNAKGFQTWRVTNYKTENQKIVLELSRNFGAEKSKIELVPRLSANEIAETVELARLEKAEKIARRLAADQKSKLRKISLKKENGRLAQIFLENPRGENILALTDVSGTITPERILTTAVLEYEKLSGRRKSPITKIWLPATKTLARKLQKLLAMLKKNWQARIEIFEISTASGDAGEAFEPLPKIEFENLRGGKSSKVSTAENISLSGAARKIIRLAPEKIDVVLTKHGETVRFCGLPFARLRNFAGREKIWFGVENKQQLLDENTLPEFSELVENLKIYRAPDAPNKRHAFYTLAPEAWLETALRRNIKRLDGNLILSPVYNQFRAGRDQIDLLALRKDGRLAIIELKTTADREVLFQSLDYWRKIEIERRAGNLQNAKIFGEMKIKNEPALIYLVAPLLDFHRDFRFLAKTIRAEIEIYRFDLNQNWREDLRVVRQEKSPAE